MFTIENYAKIVYFNIYYSTISTIYDRIIIKQIPIPTFINYE